MARWVRNLGTRPVVSSAWGTTFILSYTIELLRMLGWTLDSDDGDAFWAGSCRVIDQAPGVGGFEVDALNPRRIYDPGGRFTQAMADDSYALILRGGAANGGAGYEQNQSAWRIVTYIDANNIEVDPNGFSPFGWQTDTQMGGTVLDPVLDKPPGGGWVIYNAPSPSRAQLRLEYNSDSYLYVTMAPMGQDLVETGNGTTDAIDATGAPTCTVTLASLAGRLNKHMPGTNITIAGAANALDDGTFPITAIDNATGEVTYTNANGVGDASFSGTVTIDGIATFTDQIDIGSYYMIEARWNMYADDDGFHMYWHQQQQNTGTRYKSFFSCAKLVDVASGDTDPWYVRGDAQIGSNKPWEQELYLKMLDGAVAPASITGYPTYWKRDWDQDDGVCYANQFGMRVENGSPGKTLLVEPWVVMGDRLNSGACIRGRMSKVAIGYTGFGNSRPVDAAGTWVHFTGGNFFPRNGPNDQLPIFV